MASHMREVAKILGIRLGDEFNLRFVETGQVLREICRLTENNGLEMYTIDNYWKSDPKLLQDLLTGLWNIIRITTTREEINQCIGECSHEQERERYRPAGKEDTAIL